MTASRCFVYSGLDQVGCDGREAAIVNAFVTVTVVTSAAASYSSHVVFLHRRLL